MNKETCMKRPSHLLRAVLPLLACACLAAPDAKEFEINPVIVKANGQGLTALDALVTTR
jgi:succinyl-CoA synthetase beta subunit